MVSRNVFRCWLFGNACNAGEPLQLCYRVQHERDRTGERPLRVVAARHLALGHPRHTVIAVDPALVGRSWCVVVVFPDWTIIRAAAGPNPSPQGYKSLRRINQHYREQAGAGINGA